MYFQTATTSRYGSNSSFDEDLLSTSFCHLDANSVDIRLVSIKDIRMDSIIDAYVANSTIDVTLLQQCVASINELIGFRARLFLKNESDKLEGNETENPRTKIDTEKNDGFTGVDSYSPNCSLCRLRWKNFNRRNYNSDHYRLVEISLYHLAVAAAHESISLARKVHNSGPVRPKKKRQKRRKGVVGYKELAAKSGLSPWHFHRVFRSVTGVTPRTYGDKCLQFFEDLIKKEAEISSELQKARLSDNSWDTKTSLRGISAPLEKREPIFITEVPQFVPKQASSFESETPMTLPIADSITDTESDSETLYETSEPFYVTNQPHTVSSQSISGCEYGFNYTTSSPSSILESCNSNDVTSCSDSESTSLSDIEHLLYPFFEKSANFSINPTITILVPERQSQVFGITKARIDNFANFELELIDSDFLTEAMAAYQSDQADILVGLMKSSVKDSTRIPIESIDYMVPITF